MGGVILHGANDNVQTKRIEIALKLKGVQYAQRAEGWMNPNDDVLKSIPMITNLPVLLHNDKPVIDTLPILEYIDETWKNNRIFPDDPYQRARVRFWATFTDSVCSSAATTACFTGQPAAIANACHLLHTLESNLGDSKFFGGETIGLVDISAVSIAVWLGALEEASRVKLMRSEDFPRLCRWAAEFSNHKEVKDCLPPRERLVSNFQAFLGLGCSNSNAAAINNNPAIPQQQPFATWGANAAAMNNNNTVPIPGQPYGNWGANNYAAAARMNNAVAMPGQPFANWGANNNNNNANAAMGGQSMPYPGIWRGQY